MESCKKCGAEMEPRKYIFLARDGKKELFHYAMVCTNCKTFYYRPRTKEMYELVKNIPWELSKRMKQKQTLVQPNLL